MSVGALAFAKREDAEIYQWLLEDFVEVNRVLRSNGLPEHVEPEKVPRFRSRSTYVGQPYAMLHYLRRAVAHAIRRRKLRPLSPDIDPTTDDLYDRVLSSCESHVICHSDCEGFYVPVDFPAPLYDDLPDSDPHCIRGGILGSSQGAMRELVLVAPFLGIGLKQGQLDDAEARRIDREKQEESAYWVERQVWLRFFELARFSIAQGTAIVFQ